jgi:hypothetical protein
MHAIILAACFAYGDAPVSLRFVDEAKHDGRSVLTFRTVDFANKPASILDANDQPPPDSRFGVLPLGPGGRQHVSLVWHPESGALWIDADGDGRFATHERHTLTDAPCEVQITIAFSATEKHERTLIVRKRGDGLAYALRGYVAGAVTLGKETYRVLLTDGDADGCFDNSVADRLWIDKNRDGQFDPLTEQFTLGRPVTLGAVYVVQPNPPGNAVRVTERPTDSGRMTLHATRLGAAKVSKLDAYLISEWGESVLLQDINKETRLPVGRYRLDAVTMSVVDADGHTWTYDFHGSDRFVVTITKDSAALLDLTAGLTMNVAVREMASHHKGTLDVSPAVVTACGLTMQCCEKIDKFSARTAPEAVIAVEAPGSVALCEERSGFACGHLCSRLVRLPPSIDNDSLELVVRFPSGPLAGELRGGRMLQPDAPATDDVRGKAKSQIPKNNQ